jgi:predicted O-linked N-acetylglucosamine transferase (SPINDLY family)
LSLTLRRAITAWQRGEWADAERMGREILDVQADHFDALHLLGIIAGSTGRTQEAVDLLTKALQVNPDSAEAHDNRGVALGNLRRYDEALECSERALALAPDYAFAHFNRGVALDGLDRHAEALESYDRALALRPGFAEAHNNRSVALNRLKRHGEALAESELALALRPDYAEAHANRGRALRHLRRDAEAMASYERAIVLNPDLAEAHNNRGNLLLNLGRPAEALESFDRALGLRPESAEAHNNRGNALFELKRFEEALESYDRALALEPNHAEWHSNRGNVLRHLYRPADALACFETALRIDPESDYLHGRWLHAKMTVCDWRDIAQHFERLRQEIERRQRASPPFAVLAMLGSPALQRVAAQIWVQDQYPPNRTLPAIPKRVRRDKVRIGYFSADFREHPVSQLMAEVFERHDRLKFELLAFSFGPATDDPTRQRVAAAFDRFIDVRNLSDIDVAMLARSLEVDIAVDLGGFTQDCRAGIFAARAAPVQLGYLGYLGTMGAQYMDYLLADEVIIPPGSRTYYAEKIAYLPSYQANDTRRRTPDREFSREGLGLPPEGFVFCCFNNNFKITPARFDAWMRIMKRVEGSVLFLYADNEHAAANLRMEAVLRGVPAERLVFGGRLPAPMYMARYRVADLFLDTFPYNAGTTASDALWAGVPVLTQTGEAFASRMAASLLNAIDLPELVTSNEEKYEELAVALATQPSRLADIKRRLARNRLTTALFDMARFTRSLEAAYAAMYERYHADLAPEHLPAQN